MSGVDLLFDDESSPSIASPKRPLEEGRTLSEDKKWLYVGVSRDVSSPRCYKDMWIELNGHTGTWYQGEQHAVDLRRQGIETARQATGNELQNIFSSVRLRAVFAEALSKGPRPTLIWSSNYFGGGYAAAGTLRLEDNKVVSSPREKDAIILCVR